MFCLVWQWEDGKQCSAIGSLDSLSSIKFAVRQYYQFRVRYRLIVVETGSEIPCSWIDDSEKLPFQPVSS